MIGAHHVIDHFGDVGGVVAGALDILGHEQEMGTKPDRARVFHHVSEKLAEQAVVDLVNLVVLVPHRFGQFGISARIGVQHLLELAQRHLAHAGQRLGEPDGRLAVQDQSPLGDILGKVTDPLQFRRGLDRGQGLAEVHGHGLAQRQELQRAVLDLLLDGIDADIAAHRILCGAGITPGDGLDG